MSEILTAEGKNLPFSIKVNYIGLKKEKHYLKFDEEQMFHSKSEPVINAQEVQSTKRKYGYPKCLFISQE